MVIGTMRFGWIVAQLPAVKTEGNDTSSSTENEVNQTRARFSIMGSTDGPLAEIVSYDAEQEIVTVVSCKSGEKTLKKGTIFDYLKQQLATRAIQPSPDLPLEINGGYFGFMGYEVKKDTTVKHGNEHQSKLPDAWYIFADRFILFDHHEDHTLLVALVHEHNEAEEIFALQWFGNTRAVLQDMKEVEEPTVIGKTKRPLLHFKPDVSRSDYINKIGECLELILRGDTYEVCLTNRIRTKLPEGSQDPLSLYCALRLLNPAPYSAFLKLSSDVAVCSSSPERFMRISSHGIAESKPIKGTRRRGRTPEEDEIIRQDLATSHKDRAENLMIVDLVRNDLSRSCHEGTVLVPSLMNVESYATVHQLVSTVRGQLKDTCDTIDCIRNAYPMGSMTGAPKLRTMRIIDHLETSARGVYSGCIGYLSLCGAADLSVVIRTAIVSNCDVEIGVGGAIIALSDPEEEYNEAILKGKALMQTFAMKATGRPNYTFEHERLEAFAGEKVLDAE